MIKIDFDNYKDIYPKNYITVNDMRKELLIQRKDLVRFTACFIRFFDTEYRKMLIYHGIQPSIDIDGIFGHYNVYKESCDNGICTIKCLVHLLTYITKRDKGKINKIVWLLVHHNHVKVIKFSSLIPKSTCILYNDLHITHFTN